MSAVVTGVVIGVVGVGSGISSSHQAKKGAEHAKDRASGRAREQEDEAIASSNLSRKMARQDKAKRAVDYARNTNIFGGMAGQANAIKKTLTGQ